MDKKILKRLDCRDLPVAPDFQFEAALWESGLQYVAGIDEAGRGALAGPVAAGVVVFPPDLGLSASLQGVNDSKKLSRSERETWAERLPGLVVAWAVGLASAQEIDEFGIIAATRLAVGRALESIQLVPQHLLLDYLALPETIIPQTALVKGDARSLSIAAASILAKTARDELLRQLDRLYPVYGFAAHKGYGTKAHLQAIARHGKSPVHRQSFSIKAQSAITEMSNGK